MRADPWSAKWPGTCPIKTRTFLSRLDRLEAHLNHDQDNFDCRLKAALPTLWVPLIRDETALILDLSDLAKPMAKKMDYLATVRDGSTGQLVNGYWLVEIYASVSHKNPIPILLEPFSHEQPFCPGQNPVLIAAVRPPRSLTGPRAGGYWWWTEVGTPLRCCRIGWSISTDLWFVFAETAI